MSDETVLQLFPSARDFFVGVENDGEPRNVWLPLILPGIASSKFAVACFLIAHRKLQECS